MRAVVVRESMFGNTRQIAAAVAEGLAESHEVVVLDVNRVTPGDTGAADLVVVGGPTHAHGMSRVRSRAEAATWADQPRRALTLEPAAPGRGVRDWLEDPATVVPPLFAAFASRASVPVVVGGNAAVQIDRGLRRRGSRRLVPPEGFLVTKADALRPGELTRAREWGRRVGRAATAAPGVAPPASSPST